MSLSADPGLPQPDLTAAGADAAIRIFERLLRGFKGAAALRLWDERWHVLGRGHPAFTLVLRDPAALRRLVFDRNPLRLADTYFRGALDVDGDLYSALMLKGHFENLQLSWRDKLQLLIDACRLPAGGLADMPPSDTLRSRLARGFSHRHSRQTDRQAIAFHYDVSNEFYRLWLDEQMVYSCAYFESEDDSLDQAQSNKLEHICRKLRLRPGDRLLDIGCGWGALACWAARHHGVRARGITLSRRQCDLARERIRDQGLQDRVSVDLCDYRDVRGEAVYDKVASVGMFEHVGLAQLPTYFKTVQRLLKPGGLFLNHGITHDEEGWNDTLATRFINRYVFPDGELDCVANIQLGMERAGFEIHDVEGLRPHYAMTLRHWCERLEARSAEALQQVDETTFRVWRLYMAASALEFESGGTGIYQILASKRHHGLWPLPLTRRDLYRWP